MVYLGIDPGKKGGLALISADAVEVFPYSDEKLKEICCALDRKIHAAGEQVMCCLEQVHAMPKQGVTSTFNFGMSYGYIKGLLEIAGIPYQEIPPQRWKKEFGLNTDKQKSIEVCRKLFPDVSLKANDRCRVDNDGMAEALLMAEYARRKL